MAIGPPTFKINELWHWPYQSTRNLAKRMFLLTFFPTNDMASATLQESKSLHWFTATHLHCPHSLNQLAISVRPRSWCRLAVAIYNSTNRIYNLMSSLVVHFPWSCLPVHVMTFHSVSHVRKCGRKGKCSHCTVVSSFTTHLTSPKLQVEHPVSVISRRLMFSLLLAGWHAWHWMFSKPSQSIAVHSVSLF